MFPNPNRRSLLVILSVFIFVLVTTAIVSAIARGYQISLKPGHIPTIKATGLLSLASRPQGGSVYLDHHLVTATDDTLNLPPGDYAVKIVKDGFLPWEKTIHLKKEVVFRADVQLFRSAPDLKPITVSGAINPAISPDNSKIIFSVASASAAKDNGLYLIEFTPLLLPLGRSSPRQIAPNFPFIDWSKASFTFSPDSRQVLAAFKGITYLLNLASPITLQNLRDVTLTLGVIKNDYHRQLTALTANKLEKIPEKLKNLIATDSAKTLAYSASEDKLLYQANQNGDLPLNFVSPPPAQSTQAQSRSLKKDHYYVYDLKDDANFLLGHPGSISPPFWLPNSDNLIFVEGDAIKTIEFDATNKLTLFAGNFDHLVVFPSPDGTRLLTLTSPYTGAPKNLYSVTIR